MGQTGRSRGGVLLFGILIVCAFLYFNRSPKLIEPADTPQVEHDTPPVEHTSSNPPIPQEPVAARPSRVPTLPLPAAPPVAEPRNISNSARGIPEDEDPASDVQTSPSPQRRFDPRVMRELRQVHKTQAVQEKKFLNETLELREDEISSLQEIQRRVSLRTMDAMRTGLTGGVERMQEEESQAQQRIEQILGPQKYARYREFTEKQAAERSRLLTPLLRH